MNDIILLIDNDNLYQLKRTLQPLVSTDSHDS